MGCTRPGHRRPRLYKPPPRPEREPSQPTIETLTLAPGRRRHRRRSARLSRFAAVSFSVQFFLKKILFVVFLFRRIFHGYFLIAIFDPIFVLV